MTQYFPVALGDLGRSPQPKADLIVLRYEPGAHARPDASALRRSGRPLGARTEGREGRDLPSQRPQGRPAPEGSPRSSRGQKGAMTWYRRLRRTGGEGEWAFERLSYAIGLTLRARESCYHPAFHGTSTNEEVAIHQSTHLMKVST